MTDTAAELARHDERLKFLEDWKKMQNGRLKDIHDKLDGLKNWLIGLLGSMLVALVLLIINLATK